MKNSTLTRRLFLRIAATILVTMSIIGLFAYRSAKREINYVYDAQLINDASVLWALVEDEFREAGSDDIKQFPSIDLDANNQHAASQEADIYAQARMFRIWKSGQVVMFSDTAFPDTIARRDVGLSEVVYKNEKWRVYSQTVPDTAITIEVGEKMSLRHKLVANILWQLFFALLILMPTVGFLIWLGITSGLGTIRNLVRAIRSRSPDDLSSIPVEDLPRDLSPLGHSINQLLTKLEKSLTAERRFSDHAAHQLRTPLAALKLQLHLLSKADNESERREFIADLTKSTNRAIHLVEQLLRAARVSHQPLDLKSISLYQETASVVLEMVNVAEEKRLDIFLRGDKEAKVRADELLLRLMITNLLDNAIKYTPESGKIRIDVLSKDGLWRLAITDTGPGISECDREAVFHRFYRAHVASTDGAGLGLAIVGEIVDRLSGQIALKTPENGQGLRVEVALPRA